MKVSLTNGIGSYSGKLNEIVFCHYRREGVLIARKIVYPTITENNHRLGSTTANLHALKPSTGYKDDLRTYLWRYNALKGNEKNTLRSWVNLYFKIMHDMATSVPGIDLKALTRDEILSRELPCLSIRKAIEAGLLPEVYDWQSLDRQM